MDELLEKLLSSELLTEETKEQVGTEFKALIENAIIEARAKTEVEVRAELTEQFAVEREALVEAVDTKVEEFLRAELTELKEDIENFRDLEAEYAEKLVDEKRAIAEGFRSDMAQLIDNLDTFLEERMTAEFDELRESIEDVRKIQFGRRLFEAFEAEVKGMMADDGTQTALAEARAQLDATRQTLAESAEALEAAKRGLKMVEVLEPLSGHSREVMEAILKNVPTAKLEEAYQTFIPRVLHESTKVEAKSEKESETLVLAEGDTSTSGEKTTVVTGDTPKVTEVVTESAANVELQARLKRLAGISN